MTKKLAVVAAVIFAAGSGAYAQVADPIAVRQAGMDLLAGDFDGIRAVLAAKGDLTKQERPAKAIQRWATVIPTLFPKGTEQGGNTKALPAIWSDAAGFQKDAAALGEAAGKLAEAAKAGNADAMAVQIKAVGDACGACHRGYRAK
jgi:cytochrome c556